MRQSIEIKYNRNLRLPKAQRLSGLALARELGLAHSTFHDEIHRDLVRKPPIFNDKEVWEHSAKIAQAVIDANNLNKGCSMKMNTTVA